MTTTMMSQQLGFLQAIQDHPDDDLHRLAWADWLDDHGEHARAAFVRAQLRLAALPPGDPAAAALEDEADDLLAGHEAEWVGRLGEVAAEWRWHRGCVEQMTVWADALLRDGEELFALAPVRSLRLIAERDDLPRLAGCPFLARLEEIDLGVRPPAGSLSSGIHHRDRALMPLFVSPHLGRLRRLRLTGQGIEGPLIHAFIQGGLFGRLEALDLTENHAVGDRLCRAMAEARAPSLRSLGVRESNLTAHGLRALLRGPGLTGLEELDVIYSLLFTDGLSRHGAEEFLSLPRVPQLRSFRWQNIPFESAEPLLELLASPRMPGLRDLTIMSSMLKPEDAERLAGTTNLSGLRRLALPGNLLRDSGARALASSPHLAGLRSLNLTANGIGGPGVRALANAPSLAGLTELLLSGNYVGDAGCEALASGALRPAVLAVDTCNIGPNGAAALAASPTAARLRALQLGSNRLADEGVAALAASPQMRRLRELSLSNNDIHLAGAQSLANSPHLRRLRLLEMRNSEMTQDERAALEAWLGSGLRV